MKTRFTTIGIALFMTGCFGLGGGEESESEPAEATIECNAGDVLENDARPFERIALDVDIDGLVPPEDAEVGPADVWATFEIQDELAYVQVDWDFDEKEWFFIAPVHFKAPFEGGNAKVTIQTEDAKCTSDVLELEPLERAPGSLEAYVEKQRQLSELKASSVGLDYQNLAGQPLTQIPAPMIGPRVAREILDGPNNPNSFENIAAGTAAETELNGSLELVDAMIAASGLLDEADQEIADYRSLQPMEEEPIWSKTSAFRTTQQPLCENIPTEFLYPEISNPRTLSQYMIRANISQRALKNPVRKAFGSFVGYARNIPIPVSQGAAAVIQTLLLYQQRMYEWHANSYPRYLSNPQAELTIKKFNEDSEDEGTYSTYKISAVSKEWNLTKDLVGEVVDIIGGKISGKIVGKIEGQIAEAQKILLEQAMSQAQNDLKEIADQLAPDGCVLPRKVWPQIPGFENPTYHVSEFTGAIKQSENTADPVGLTTRYQVAKPGNGVVTLRVPANAFPPAANVKYSEWKGNVAVDPIKVAVVPDTIRVDPGETITVTAQVENADDERVMWTDNVYDIQKSPFKDWFQILESDETSATIRFNTDAPSDENILVFARSISQKGIRLGKIHDDPREGFGLYRVGAKVDVRPKFKCLEPGESFTFEAEVFGDDENRVDWDSTLGTVSSDGTFKSDEKGTGRVIASPQDFPDEEDHATVRVGGCRCEWNFELIGARSGIWGGTINAAATLNNGVLALNFNNGEDGTFAGSISALGVTRGTGTYPARASAKDNDSDNPIDLAVTYDDSGELTITQWDELRIQGNFFGEGYAVPDLLLMEPAPIRFRIYFDVLIGNYDEFPRTLINSCEGGVFTDLF